MILDWPRQLIRLRWAGAAAPAALAALGVAMAASSTPRPDNDRTAEAVARATRGDFGEAGFRRMTDGYDAAVLAVAARASTSGGVDRLYLTPGWDNLTLGGKPDPFAAQKAGLEAQRLNAARAFAKGALAPAQPFSLGPVSAETRRRALRCLTQAVYYEAALEPTAGQEGVAQVVLNRVRDPNYPDTVCGVVFQGAERTTGCQFSFTCDGAMSQAPVKWAWDRARIVAERALNGAVATSVGTATHYHADYVHPWWSPTLTKLNQIGAHIFYRWKGAFGEPSAFVQRYAGREPAIDEARFSRPRLVVAKDETVPEGAKAAEEAGAAVRTVEIDGQTRVVGVLSLGGRRQATAEDVAAINARLAEYEQSKSAPSPAAAAPPAGVTPMAVEEVGRPAP